MKHTPAISINMTVYNGEKYIAEAIRSVLNQTFDDFEFIIIDDGSTDNTSGIIRSFRDKRMMHITNPHDYIRSLNTGLEKSSGRYIARMDADDIMHPDRLSVQHAIMEAHPDIDVAGTWMYCFDESGSERIWSTHGGYVDEPLKALLKSCFVLHPTSMVRKSLIDQHHLRYQPYLYAEDYKLWSDAAKYGARFYIDSQLLHYYRISTGQNSSRYKKEQSENTFNVQKDIIACLMEKQTECYSDFLGIYEHALFLCENGKLTKELFLEFFFKLLFR